MREMRQEAQSKKSVNAYSNRGTKHSWLL